MKEYKILIGNKETTFRLDNFAEQANGSFFVCSGDTVVLSIVTMYKNKREEIDFFPLIVDYEEKFYAAGKIGGSKYTRREAKPTNSAITNSRLIDRAIRPAFPSELEGVDVQVVSSCLSWDKESDTAIMALLATSISLMISDIPFNGPIGAVRIIKKDGQFVINPSCSERNLAEMDVVYSGLKDKSGNILINMIEGEFKETSNNDVAESFRIAQGVIKELCDFQEGIVKEIGKEKVVFEIEEISEDFEDFEEKKLVPMTWAKGQWKLIIDFAGRGNIRSATQFLAQIQGITLEEATVLARDSAAITVVNGVSRDVADRLLIEFQKLGMQGKIISI